jgi:hypothetical protein
MADYATLLRDHTTLTCRSVDRIFLQGYVPGLQSPGLVARFLLQRRYPFPSSAALGEIGRSTWPRSSGGRRQRACRSGTSRRARRRRPSLNLCWRRQPMKVVKGGSDNWRALRSVGENANRRLCDAQAEDARPAPDVVTFAQVTRPSNTPDGLHAPALCFGDPRVMTILAALLLFCHVVAGFRNRDLVELVGSLLDQPYTGRQATYDLRRLRRKGLILRSPHSHCYRLTSLGRRVAILFTKAHGRVLAPGLALLDPVLPPDVAAKSPLGRAWRQLDNALEDFVARQLIAA